MKKIEYRKEFETAMFESNLRALKQKIKKHGHHIIFILGIISLTLLATWWSVFINRSIEERRGFHMENLMLTLKLYSHQLGNSSETSIEQGVFREDDRFEIIYCQKGNDTFSKPLLPRHSTFCIRIKKHILNSIERDYKRKKIMITGESGLLFLLLLFSSILLYQFIRLERRSTLEMEEFWGRVTHEIKTPITGIKAFLQSLKNNSLTPEQMPPFVSMALEQIEKQEQLAENILAGYGLRNTNNNHILKLEDLNINECIHTYFDQHMIHLTEAKVSIQLQRNADIIVRSDFQLLKIILDNLVYNALKYCSPGLILSVQTYSMNKWGIISITDNGPGFPPEMSKRLFQAYKHLKGELPGNKHGSGMGLYIARRLAEQMGGRLEAYSPGENQGSEFRIFLILSKSTQPSSNFLTPDNNQEEIHEV